MPRNQVVENICDRCTRSWYTKTDEKQIEVLVKVAYDETDAQPLGVELKCLCDGCRKTVRGLLESITKVMTKSAPIRGAKKVASEDKTPPTTSVAATDVAPVPPAVERAVATGGKQLASSSAVSSTAPVSSHPKR